MLNFELVRILIALAGTAYLAWEDNRTSFMDERVLYGMIACGAILTLASLDAAFIIPTAVIAALIFGVGYFGYRAGGIGGGDVLLFTGLHLLLPVQPTILRTLFLDVVAPHTEFARMMAYNTINASLPPALSTLIASSLLALLGTAVMYAWLMRKSQLKPDWAYAGLAALACVACFWVVQRNLPLGAVQAALLVGIFAPAIFLTAFRTQITKEIIVRRVALDEIEDEDVLAIDALPAAVVDKYDLVRLLDRDGLQRLTKAAKAEGMKTVPIAKVLPRLGPYILAGLLAVLLVGDVLAFFLLLA